MKTKRKMTKRKTKLMAKRKAKKKKFPKKPQGLMCPNYWRRHKKLEAKGELKAMFFSCHYCIC